jgi:hypothetical protein
MDTKRPGRWQYSFTERKTWHSFTTNEKYNAGFSNWVTEMETGKKRKKGKKQKKNKKTRKQKQKKTTKAKTKKSIYLIIYIFWLFNGAAVFNMIRTNTFM